MQETLGKVAEALDQLVGELAALEKRTAALEKPSAATLAITTGGGGRAYLKTEQSNIVAQILRELCRPSPPLLARSGL